MDWTYRWTVVNPVIGQPYVMVDTYGATRFADQPLALTSMAVHDRIDVPQFGFWVQRNADFDDKAFVFGLY